MTTLYRDKRTLERELGCRTEFRRYSTDTDAPVEIHACEPQEVDTLDDMGRPPAGPTTWLGAGETHDDALHDAWETLRVRGVAEARAAAVDHWHEAGA